jgi:hypothetical protein
MSDPVEVQVLIDTAPTQGGHRVVLRNDAGQRIWIIGNDNPNVLILDEGDELTLTASVRGRSIKGRTTKDESETWALRVQRGEHASIQVGGSGMARPIRWVRVVVSGATKIGRVEAG